MIVYMIQKLQSVVIIVIYGCWFSGNSGQDRNSKMVSWTTRVWMSRQKDWVCSII